MFQFSHTNGTHVRYGGGGEDIIFGDRIEAPLFKQETVAGDITVSNAGAASGNKVYHGFPLSPAPYWITPAVSNVVMAVTSTNSAHMTMSVNFVNNTSNEYAHGVFNIIDFPRLVRMVRILGMIAVISYMAVILFTWIYANLQGYVYFSAGEPVLMIKYSEWVLGFIGIFAAVDLLRKELDNEASYKKVL